MRRGDGFFSLIVDHVVGHKPEIIVLENVDYLWRSNDFKNVLQRNKKFEFLYIKTMDIN